MKRFLSILVASVMMCLTLAGCGLLTKDSSGGTERGIKKIGDSTCYKIDLQGGEVEDYFTLIQPQGKVYMTIPGESYWTDSGMRSGDRNITVNYSKIEEGGWVAYWGDLVIYLPPEVKEKSVQSACGSVGYLSSSECFTVDEVREYLPWI